MPLRLLKFALAKGYGMKKIAILGKNYISGGNKNTTIIRSNYLTLEGVKFYDESVRLWQDFSTDFASRRWQWQKFPSQARTGY